MTVKKTAAAKTRTSQVKAQAVEVSAETKRINAALDALFSKNEVISASELADIVDVDAKQVRAFMRSAKLRDQSQLKNATWRVDRKIAETVVNRFTKKASQTS